MPEQIGEGFYRLINRESLEPPFHHVYLRPLEGNRVKVTFLFDALTAEEGEVYDLKPIRGLLSPASREEVEANVGIAEQRVRVVKDLVARAFPE